MIINYAFVNGVIHTLEGDIVEAVAISGDKFATAGSNSEIKELCSSETQIVDLEGKYVFPGFNDSHMHLVLFGLMFDKIDLRGAHSIEEIIKRGRSFIKEKNKKPGEFIIGYGFDQNVFSDKRLPLKEDVDLISKDHPILLDRICGHIGIANTLALKVMGITKDTVIKGGNIHKDASGNLNGIIDEAALDWFKSRIPKPGVPEIKDTILKATNEALRHGLTSIQTDDLEGTDFDTMFKSYSSLADEDKLPVRIYEEVQAARCDKLKRFLDRGMRTGYGNDYFRIGNIKLLTDGSLGARTAALKDDYTDAPGNKGINVYTQEEMDEVIAMAHNAGMQVACHAIGDSAIEQVINSIEKAVKANNKQMRHRVVHCQIANPELFKRMVKLGITADIQPAFVPSDYELAEKRIGIERCKKSYAWKTMLNYGIHMGGGSDCPVESFDPMWGIYCAVNRQDANGNPHGGWMADEKLTVDEAIKLYTIGSAYNSFDENKKGTIKAGKMADMVVLSEDPYKVNPKDIKDIQVLMTVVGGKIRFAK